MLPGCISAPACTRLIAMCGARIDAVEAALQRNHPEIVVGETMFTFQEISSRGCHRFDLLLDQSEPELEGVDAAWLPAVCAAMGHARADLELQVSVV